MGLYIIPLVLYVLVFTWNTKGCGQSWKTWKGRWWWMAGMVIAEVVIQGL